MVRKGKGQEKERVGERKGKRKGNDGKGSGEEVELAKLSLTKLAHTSVRGGKEILNATLWI